MVHSGPGSDAQLDFRAVNRPSRVPGVVKLDMSLLTTSGSEFYDLGDGQVQWLRYG